MLGRAVVERKWWLVPVLGLAIGMGAAMTLGSWEGQGLLMAALIIGISALILIPRMTKSDTDGFLLRVLSAGLFLKLVVAMILLWVMSTYYDGGDAWAHYHSAGIRIVQHIRQLEFDQLTTFLGWGTQFTQLSTGVIYSLVGPSLYGGYLVYALLSFVGSCFFYKAFRVSFPDRDSRLYAVLVFLAPSILYHANGIGKDALIFMALGLSAYGAACLFRQQLGGVAMLCMGLLGVLWIRPHVAAMLALSLGIAFLLQIIWRKRPFRFSTYALGLVAIVVIAWFLVPRGLGFLGLEELSVASIIDYLELRQVQTLAGGSQYDPVDMSSPLGFPLALVTVVLRPFPWEADNLQSMIQSFEGILLLGLIIWSVGNLGRALRDSISDAYLMYIVIFTVLFVIAFASFSNFGTLARERAMLLPFLFALIAYKRAGLGTIAATFPSLKIGRTQVSTKT